MLRKVRYRCGSMLAKRDGDSVHPDIVAGVPDSGIAHAIGYANESGIPYARPFIKVHTDMAEIIYADQPKVSVT